MPRRQVEVFRNLSPLALHESTGRRFVNGFPFQNNSGDITSYRHPLQQSNQIKMLRITLILLLSISVFGFAPSSFSPPTAAMATNRSPVALRMAEEPEEPQSMVSSKFEAANQNPQNLVRDVNNDPKWRDTEIGANTQFDFLNFSTIFVIVPRKFTVDFHRGSLNNM